MAEAQDCLPERVRRFVAVLPKVPALVGVGPTTWLIIEGGLVRAPLNAGNHEPIGVFRTTGRKFGKIDVSLGYGPEVLEIGKSTNLEDLFDSGALP